MITDLTPVQQTQVRLGRDRPLAHAVLFRHRHHNKTPDFHRELILDWHAPDTCYLDMVFRGGAKSTIAEEAIVIRTLFREFRNCLIVGQDADRAAARVRAIAHELETNEMIREIFGDIRGNSWAPESGRIVTSTDICIQSLGRGQSLRGIKFLDHRPDLLFADDLEGEYSDVDKPEKREKIHRWFDGDLLPALEPGYMARMAATPLHPEALPCHVMQDPNWKVHRFPIKYPDPETGEWKSSWPARFPLTEAEARVLKKTNPKVQSIESIETGLLKKGQISIWQCEYMCQAESPETKPFKAEMFRVEPQVRTWQAVFSMFDPARTVGPKAASTGKVTWSWMNNRLVVWDAWGKLLLPDQIIDALFEEQREHRPVWIGFEEDGLNQWALQPIRQKMVALGEALPLKAVKAPPGKTEFIKGLQPFFNAREVVFAKDLPDLKGQLLGFPSGRIDVPNALAYALKMRPGAPIYSDFGARHVEENLEPSPSRPLFLCLNGSPSLLTSAVVQVLDGAVRVFADAVREGEPALLLGDLLRDLQADFGRDFNLVAPPHHFDRYNNVGIVAAAAKLPKRVLSGMTVDRGRLRMTELLQRERAGMPMFMVSSAATWTLNGLASGYSRVLLKQGQLADYAEEGPYRLLIEGLESYVAFTELGSTGGYGSATLNAETAEGRPYRSMLGGARGAPASKDDW